jgi:hypothetical protein
VRRRLSRYAARGLELVAHRNETSPAPLGFL